MAHTVSHDFPKISNSDLLEDLSRQPFLWRSLPQYLEPASLVDGVYVGYAVNSFWSDPSRARGDRLVAVPSGIEGEVEVSVSVEGNEEVCFRALTPLVFYGELRDCRIEAPIDIELRGQRGASALYMRGDVIVICQSLNLGAQNIWIEKDGETWLEAQTVIVPPQLRLQVSEKARVGWGGILERSHPWKTFNQSLPPPYLSPQQTTPLRALIQECAWRLPSAAPIILSKDFTAPAGDHKLDWAERRFPGNFPELIRLMVAHGLASSEPTDTSGSPKLRVRFRTAWSDLVEAIQDIQTHPEFEEFIRQT